MRVGGCEFGGTPSCDEGGERAAVHPLEVRSMRAGHVRRSEINTDRVPRLPDCDQNREKNHPTLNRLCSTTREFPTPHHTRQLPPLVQVTEYLAPAPQSGSFEPDNAAATHPPHTTGLDCHRVHDILPAIANSSRPQPLA